jgi:diguanylate cyclase
MLPSSSDTTQTAWLDIFAAVSPTVRQQIATMVDALADSLASRFYDTMLSDDVVGRLLDHHLVNQRLHASMARWLRQLFDLTVSVPDMVSVQKRTGEVHARVGVPIQQVARGARVLKHTLTEHLIRADMSRNDLAQAICYVHELIDLAVEVMNSSYARTANRMERSDEAYRLFFLSQNLKAERERQKLQLLEWAQQIMARYYWEVPGGDSPSPSAPNFGHSQFGMWLQHKASILFEGAPEIALIQQHIAVIEETLLPRLGRARASREDARALVGEINLNIERIKMLLATMFDRYSEAEDGRDSVTNLLNRRYLPAVAKREIGIALNQGQECAMLVVDIDGFKPLRDVLGLEYADMVLRQVGETLVDHLRAGDFVFRIGDDQFLALVVECAADALMPLSNGLRERVAMTRLRTPDYASALVTVSIGVAKFDGHPDYQRLLDRATDALRQAKVGGRNRCVLAP